IRDLILEIWRHGWDTSGSCQGEESDKPAYVSFPINEDGHKFYELLQRAGIAATTNDADGAIHDQLADGTEIPLLKFRSLHVFFYAAAIPEITSLMRNVERQSARTT